MHFQDLYAEPHYYATQAHDFQQDGILIVNKHGHYDLDTRVSPLMLMWKDSHCSRFVSGFSTNKPTNVVLEVSTDDDGQSDDEKDLVLRSHDRFVLGRLQETMRHRSAVPFTSPFRSGDLVRLQLTCPLKLVAQIETQTVEIQGLDNPDALILDRKCSIQRSHADSLSKIVFQSSLNESGQPPVPVEQIMARLGGYR